MTRRERAILMSFILVPLAGQATGRRAAEIVRTSPGAFFSLSDLHCGEFLRLAIKVSNDCRRLVKRGYLEEVGRVTHKYERPIFRHPRGGITTIYESPQYFLSESGFNLALSMNWKSLPPLLPQPKRRKKKASRNPFAVDAFAASKSFLRSIEIKDLRCE